MPQREGSPWTGVWTVVMKETADHLTSVRLWLLEGLILLAAGGAVYAAIGKIRDTLGQDPFLFLSLFTVARQPLPSFVLFLGFLVPLVSIALGFDAVNSEHSRRTLSRVLAQPIYRDALLIGKFLAGIITLAIAFLTLWLLVIGLGLLLLGVPPGGEEILRGFSFLLVTVAYGGVWLALAMLFSVLFRQQATSALASLAAWLLFAVFWGMLAPLIADALGPGGTTPAACDCETLAQRAVRRSYACPSQPRHARAGSGALFAAGRRRDWHAAAFRAKFAAHMAATNRAHRGGHRDVHHRLRGFSAPGDQGVEWVTIAPLIDCRESSMLNRESSFGGFSCGSLRVSPVP